MGSTLGELIRDACSGGVKHKALGDIGTFVRGNGLQKKDLAESGVGAIHYGEIHTHYGIWAKKTRSFVPHDLALRLRQAQPGNLVIATTSEDDDAVGKAVAWLGDDAIAVSGDAYIFRHSLSPKYVAYFFSSSLFQSQKRKYITGAKVRRISGDSMKRVYIPVPSLEIQEEIARTLEGYAALEAQLRTELRAEGEARRKQYSYYRNALLAFESGSAESALLGDIAQIGTGSHDTKDAVEGGKYVFYARGRKPLRLDSYDFEEAAIITAGDGAGVGKVFHWVQGKYALHQRAYRIVPNESIVARYVYHYLATHFFDYIMKASHSSSVTSLRRPMFLKMPIAIPSLSEQHRIVSTLDKFDTLTNALSDGLSVEAKSRRRQFEYYRDQLFTFRNVEEEVA